MFAFFEILEGNFILFKSHKIRKSLVILTSMFQYSFWSIAYNNLRHPGEAQSKCFYICTWNIFLFSWKWNPFSELKSIFLYYLNYKIFLPAECIYAVSRLTMLNSHDFNKIPSFSYFLHWNVQRQIKILYIEVWPDLYIEVISFILVYHIAITLPIRINLIWLRRY